MAFIKTCAGSRSPLCCGVPPAPVRAICCGFALGNPGSGCCIISAPQLRCRELAGALSRTCLPTRSHSHTLWRASYHQAQPLQSSASEPASAPRAATAAAACSRRRPQPPAAHPPPARRPPDDVAADLHSGCGPHILWLRHVAEPGQGPGLHRRPVAGAPELAAVPAARRDHDAGGARPGAHLAVEHVCRRRRGASPSSSPAEACTHLHGRSGALLHPCSMPTQPHPMRSPRCSAGPLCDVCRARRRPHHQWRWHRAHGAFPAHHLRPLPADALPHKQQASSRVWGWWAAPLCMLRVQRVMRHSLGAGRGKTARVQ